MQPLTGNTIKSIHSYWTAANFLAAGQIFLKENALLKEPLKASHIKPRLLGHWGTSPGLNFIYVHLNRLIKDTGANILFIAGPGHGAPAVLANLYLEGTYTDHYPDVTQDEKGMTLLFRRFSSPFGIPSHVSAQTPGSLHEGGELGYAMVHAVGAVFDNPGLIAACVIGDGEAETGPLSASWKSVNYLNAQRDGAVLPVLHLNKYKISSVTIDGSTDDIRLEMLFKGYGYDPLFVEGGDDPIALHYAMANALNKAYNSITAIKQQAAEKKGDGIPAWPVIILRTPKGWTCPKELDGEPLEGSYRSHQVPLKDAKKDEAQLKLLEQWLKSYEPGKLFDRNGKLVPELKKMIPEDSHRMGQNAQSNGGSLYQTLKLPQWKDYGLPVEKKGATTAEATKVLGTFLRDIFKQNREEKNFRIFCPDEISSNRLDAVFEATNRCFTGNIPGGDEFIAPDGRVMEVLSEHLCQGWMEGYILSGRHGLFACYEAFAAIVDSMATQYAKWLKMAMETEWRKPVASFNYLLTSHAWRQDHNGYSHQGPGFIDNLASKKGDIIRIYLPPDANCLLSVTDHCLKSKYHINLIIAGKQPALQWLNKEEAEAHCTEGISTWEWAGNNNQEKPDIILASAGDVPTLETIAASWLLKQHCPEMNIRVVNVINLMTLKPQKFHPHGLSEEKFSQIFTNETDVIFAFHGYVALIHDLIHGRPNPERFHVRGYKEEGTTTTPFDMVVMNEISRCHLCIEALKRSKRFTDHPAQLYFQNKLAEHKAYIEKHLEDMPEIQNWKWQTG
jgi:xylulose-5-phosphate/fructose-6-phosphate phosphoketolase